MDIGDPKGLSGSTKALQRLSCDSENNQVEAEFLELFEHLKNQWEQGDLTMVNQTLTQILSKTRENRDIIEIPNAYVESAVLTLWNMLATIDPKCSSVVTGVSRVIDRILRNSNGSLDIFYAMNPLQRLLELATTTDYRTSLSVHEVIRLVSCRLSVDEAVTLIQFLLNIINNSSGDLSEVELVQTALASTGLTSKTLDDDALGQILPNLLQMLKNALAPHCRYLLHNYTSFAIRELVKRHVNIFEADPELFSLVMSSLSDIRMQPFDNYLKVLSILLSEFPSEQLVAAIPLTTILRALDLSRYDDNNTVTLFAILGSLVAKSPAIISSLCSDDAISIFSNFTCAKSFKICHAAANFFWIAILHGTVSERMTFLCNNEILEAIIHNISIEDEIFLTDVIAPALSIMLQQVTELTGDHRAAADHVIQSLLAAISELDPCPEILHKFL